jgi:P-type Ca2+ transporter type 2C
VFMELIIDPVSSIVFENEEEEGDIMKRNPRSRKHKFFSKKRILTSVAQGLSLLVVTVAIYFLATRLGFNEDQVRALTFSTLIISNLLLVLSNLSNAKSVVSILKRPELPVVVTLVAALSILVLILYVPGLSHVFHLQVFPPQYFLMVIAAGVLSISWHEVVKRKMKVVSVVSIPD